MHGDDELSDKRAAYELNEKLSVFFDDKPELLPMRSFVANATKARFSYAKLVNA